MKFLIFLSFIIFSFQSVNASGITIHDGNDFSIDQFDNVTIKTEPILDLAKLENVYFYEYSGVFSKPPYIKVDCRDGCKQEIIKNEYGGFTTDINYVIEKNNIYILENEVKFGPYELIIITRHKDGKIIFKAKDSTTHYDVFHFKGKTYTYKQILPIVFTSDYNDFSAGFCKNGVEKCRLFHNNKLGDKEYDYLYNFNWSPDGKNFFYSVMDDNKETFNIVQNGRIIDRNLLNFGNISFSPNSLHYAYGTIKYIDDTKAKTSLNFNLDGVEISDFLGLDPSNSYISYTSDSQKLYFLLVNDRIEFDYKPQVVELDIYRFLFHHYKLDYNKWESNLNKIYYNVDRKGKAESIIIYNNLSFYFSKKIESKTSAKNKVIYKFLKSNIDKKIKTLQ